MVEKVSFFRSKSVFDCTYHQSNKATQVPTVLVYPKNSMAPSSWGFLSEHPTEQISEDKELKEWFKTYLDEERLQAALRDPGNRGICPASIQEVERL